MFLEYDIKRNFGHWRFDKEGVKYNLLVKLLKERHPLESIETIKNLIAWHIFFGAFKSSNTNESFYPNLFERWEEEDEDDYEEEEEEEEKGRVPQAEKEAPHLYYSGDGTYQKEFDYYWKKLVPGQGNADTVQGELLRCISSIVYDRYNNGFGNNREDETEQLAKYQGKFTTYLKNPDAFNRFYRYYREIDFGYQHYVDDNWIGDIFFDRIVDAIIKYIMNSEELELLPEGDKYFKE